MKNPSIDRAISDLASYNRDHAFVHHEYTEEMKQYIDLRDGNPCAVSEAHTIFVGSTNGTLSADPLRNVKYLFVCHATLATRYSIDGGVHPELAYTISDVFIRRMDLCTSIEQVVALHDDLVQYFFGQVMRAKQHGVYSKPIIQCIGYIDSHLYETITLRTLAQALRLTPSYLSALFKKECGVTLTRYIRTQKIRQAQMLLRYCDSTIADISALLGFHSESRFIELFRSETGITPKKYRDMRIAINPHIPTD